MLIVDDVYEEILRNHVLFSHNYLHKIENVNHSAEGVNLACGDEIKIRIRSDNDKIRDIGFDGNCCEVVKSSASLMIQELKGKTVLDAERLFLHVQEIISSNTQYDSSFQVLIKQLSYMPIGKKHHNSIVCALLPWKVMLRALQVKNYAQNATKSKKDYSLFLE